MANHYDHDRYHQAIHPGGHGVQLHQNGGLWTCRCCGYQGVPTRVSKASTAGWVLAIVLAMACVTLPICWLPLIGLRDHTTLCPRCHTPYGTV